MIQKPDETSKQKSISLTFNTNMENGSKFSLRNSNDEEIISFESKENFRTLILSSKDIVAGKYTLYQNDNKIEEITVK